LTDVYLLALAVRRGRRLETFDRSISLAAFRGATAAHLVVLWHVNHLCEARAPIGAISFAAAARSTQRHTAVPMHETRPNVGYFYLLKFAFDGHGRAWRLQAAHEGSARNAGAD